MGYAISAGVCLLLLGFLVAGWLAGYQRADAAPPPLLPQDGTPRITLPRAAAAALIATIPLCLLFALRSAVLIFPVLTLILWRGVGPRALTAVAAGLLGVVVPLVYAVTSPRDRGGFNFEYSIDLIWAHWVGVAALILLMVVCWRLLAAARRTRRPSGPSPERPAPRTLRPRRMAAGSRPRAPLARASLSASRGECGVTVRAAGEERIRGTSRRRPRLFPTPGALAVALFVCVVAPITLAALQIDANPKFSPLDEVAHFDYVDRVAQGEVPRQGQRLLKSTLHEVACRKVALEGVNTPPCATRDLEYEQFSATYQYEAQQPPTYYVLTLPVRWVMKDVFGLAKLDATRAVSVLLLVFGLLLTWAAGRIMGIAPLALGGALLLLAVAPTVVYSAGTVSNDATAIPRRGSSRWPRRLHTGAEDALGLMLLGAGFLAAAGCHEPLCGGGRLCAVRGRRDRERTGGERWEATLRRWLPTGGALLWGRSRHRHLVARPPLPLAHRPRRGAVFRCAPGRGPAPLGPAAGRPPSSSSR